MTDDTVTRLAEKICEYFRHAVPGKGAEMHIESLLREAMEKAYIEGGAVDNVIFHKKSYEEGLTRAAEVAREVGERLDHTECMCEQIAAAIEKLREEK